MSRAVAAFALYALVTALLFVELLPDLPRALFSDLGDPLLNTSILAWNARVLPLSTEWWNFPSFAPLSGVTAFTEHLLLAYPVTTPIVLATGNAVLAHNVMLLLAFPLNGTAAFLLARELTGSSLAGLVGGLAFAFAPYQSVHLSHLQTLMAWGMPLALLGLHRTLAPGRVPRGALLLFGTGWLMTALANAYVLVFFPVLVAFWTIWFVRPAEWRRVVWLVGTAVAFTLPLLPLLAGYLERQAAYGFTRERREILLFSADMVGLSGISHRATLWRGLLPHTYEESALFPGLVIAGLAALAIWRAQPWGAVARSRGAARLVYLAGLLAAITAARAWMGPFGWRLGPLPLPPFAPYQLLTVAALVLLGAVARSSRVRAAWARRDVVAFYTAAVLLLWVCALGPAPEWAGFWRALSHGPYAVLVQLPGFSGVRVPARLWLPATVCLAVLAAFGSLALVRRRALVAVVLVAIAAEGWFYDVRQQVPAPTPPGLVPAGALVLDLPIDEGFWNAIPQYRAVLGGYRTLNGYSGYEPRHFNGMRHAIADRVPDALDPYRRLADLHVFIRPGTDPHVARWIEEHPDAERRQVSADLEVVRLPRLDPEAPRVALPLPLPGPRTPPFGVR